MNEQTGKENIDGKEEDSPEIKVILLGESGVGKTNLINVAMGQKFDPDSKLSVVNSYSRGVIEIEGKKHHYALWDTAGQEKFRSISKIFIKGAHIVIIVFSIDNRESFQQIDYWINSAKEVLESEEYIMALAANKSDLLDQSNIISDEEIDKKAKELKMKAKRTSALVDAKGFKNYLNHLLKCYIRKVNPNFSKDTKSVKIDKTGHKNRAKKKKCC